MRMCGLERWLLLFLTTAMTSQGKALFTNQKQASNKPLSKESLTPQELVLHCIDKAKVVHYRDLIDNEKPAFVKTCKIIWEKLINNIMRKLTSDTDLDVALADLLGSSVHRADLGPGLIRISKSTYNDIVAKLLDQQVDENAARTKMDGLESNDSANWVDEDDDGDDDDMYDWLEEDDDKDDDSSDRLTPENNDEDVSDVLSNDVEGKSKDSTPKEEDKKRTNQVDLNEKQAEFLRMHAPPRYAHVRPGRSYPSSLMPWLPQYRSQFLVMNPQVTGGSSEYTARMADMKRPVLQGAFRVDDGMEVNRRKKRWAGSETRYDNLYDMLRTRLSASKKNRLSDVTSSLLRRQRLRQLSEDSIDEPHIIRKRDVTSSHGSQHHLNDLDSPNQHPGSLNPAIRQQHRMDRSLYQLDWIRHQIKNLVSRIWQHEDPEAFHELNALVKIMHQLEYSINLDQDYNRLAKVNPKEKPTYVDDNPMIDGPHNIYDMHKKDLPSTNSDGSEILGDINAENDINDAQNEHNNSKQKQKHYVSKEHGHPFMYKALKRQSPSLQYDTIGEDYPEQEQSENDKRGRMNHGSSEHPSSQGGSVGYLPAGGLGDYAADMALGVYSKILHDHYTRYGSDATIRHVRPFVG